MQYLLDANVLIDANRDYYPISRIPEFWSWLVHQGNEGNVKIPIEVYEELKEGTDELALWAKSNATKNALLLIEEVNVALVARIIDEGYAADLTDDEVGKIGRDPFLIAYALAHPKERCIVTTEVSKPSKQRANRRIPNVCHSFDLACCNTFAFIRALNFNTNWRTST